MNTSFKMFHILRFDGTGNNTDETKRAKSLEKHAIL